MKKISTLFLKDPIDLGRVTNVVNPENQWVFDDEGIATRKYDGAACAIIDSELYKRYDVKKGRQVPDGAIPCQEPDMITGHHPHWVKCDRNKPEDKYFFEAFDKLVDTIEKTNNYYMELFAMDFNVWANLANSLTGKPIKDQELVFLKEHPDKNLKLNEETKKFELFDGTYELIGEKVQGNPEKIVGHTLIKHGITVLNIPELSYRGLREYLSNPSNDIEGIVFHHKSDNRMCKLRKSDFGIRR